MKLSIKQVTDKNLWDDFVTASKAHTFLHSWAWGEFNEATGDKVWRLGIYLNPAGSPRSRGGSAGSPRSRGGSAGSDPAGLSAIALIIKVHAKRGNFLFVPQGPIFAESENRNDKFSPFGGSPAGRQILKTLTEYLRELAKKNKVNFIRISPLLENNEENKKLFKELGFRPAPIHMHAETTWSLDLSPSEDELLMAMRKTTRNLIRRSVKEGVIIKNGASGEEVEIFNNLYKETVKKHGFVPFSLSYLKNQVSIFSADDSVRVFTAYYRNEPVASAIIIFYGDSAFYHHGASSAKYPKIPAAYLLQWEAIKEAKRRGHKFYNFWGIIPEDNSKPSFAPTELRKGKHPWAGITLFKKGFGGFQTDYLHAQDLPLSFWYWPNYIFETLRRIKRGL